MLVNLKTILKDAELKGYAIPATNIDNEHNLRACLAAAEKMNSPIILNVTPVANPDILMFGRLAVELAKNSKQLVCLNLDHSRTYEDCLLGIKAGFTSIMYDQSKLSFEENVKNVREIVKIAHALDVSVEGELGHVGLGLNYDVDGKTALTDPTQALEYVKLTGVDALAVAVGTAHGAYKGLPTIYFDRLEKIDELVDVPLVLHGGSGSGAENLKRSIEFGVRKINLSNDLRRSAIENLNSRDLSGNEVYNMYPLLAEGYCNKVIEYMELFNSVDRCNK